MAASPIGRRPPPTPIERILGPFHEFVHTESSGGIVLLIAAVIALVWANSPLAESYHDVWGTYLSIGVGDWSFKLSAHHFINDALMAVFFFLVGLEIKREMLVGELASARAAALPIAGAAGGAIVPALIYFAINPAGVEAEVVIVADASKRVRRLGTRSPLPVEVDPFGAAIQTEFLSAIGGVPTLRRTQRGEPFVTDAGNWIYDCAFAEGIADPFATARALQDRVGIMEHGLFLSLATAVVIADGHDVSVLRHEQSESTG